MPREPIRTPGPISLSDQTKADFDILFQLDLLLEQEFGRSGGPRFVQKLLDELFISVVAHAIRNGFFRLPAKLGSFRLCRMPPSSTPATATSKPKKRLPMVRLEFSEGDTVKVALGKTFNFDYAKPHKLTRKVRAREQEQVAAMVDATRADIAAFLKGPKR